MGINQAAEEQVNAQRPRVETFSARKIPLLSSGSTMTLLGETPGLWAHIKVYADGGENGMHSHAAEDHLFYVLEGQARFFGPDEHETLVGPNEGVLVPHGALYSFRATGLSNLVMLRVGSAIAGASEERVISKKSGDALPKAMMIRLGEDGHDFSPATDANGAGALQGVPIPGSFVGD